MTSYYQYFIIMYRLGSRLRQLHFSLPLIHTHWAPGPTSSWSFTAVNVMGKSVTSLGLFEQMTNPPLHTYYWQLYDVVLVFSLHRGRKRRKSYASFASYPTDARVGVGGVAGWVLPWFQSLLTRGRGRGAGDNPYAWQILTGPTINVPRKFVPNSSPNLRQIVGPPRATSPFPSLAPFFHVRFP
jgi:hypothetical protein